MSKRRIGLELKAFLNKDSTILQISRWAFRVYNDNLGTMDTKSKDLFQVLFFMEEDPVFEKSRTELMDIANDLIFEGEQEEIQSDQDLRNRKLERLDENWVMCPSCTDSWEIDETYLLVICPQCKTKYMNPKKFPDAANST